MTREEFDEKSFDELIEMLRGEHNDIISYDMLKEYVKKQIDDDDINLARHILEAIWNSPNRIDGNWYQYDYTAGTYDTPRELSTKDDIEEFFAIEKE